MDGRPVLIVYIYPVEIQDDSPGTGDGFPGSGVDYNKHDSCRCL